MQRIGRRILPLFASLLIIVEFNVVSKTHLAYIAASLNDGNPGVGVDQHDHDSLPELPTFQIPLFLDVTLRILGSCG